MFKLRKGASYFPKEGYYITDPVPSPKLNQHDHPKDRFQISKCNVDHLGTKKKIEVEKRSLKTYEDLIKFIEPEDCGSYAAYDQNNRELEGSITVENIFIKKINKPSSSTNLSVVVIVSESEKKKFIMPLNSTYADLEKRVKAWLNASYLKICDKDKCEVDELGIIDINEAPFTLKNFKVM